MNRSCLLAVLCCLILFPVRLSAADLTHIDRKIAKEPAYKIETQILPPCLRAGGEDVRVWLVQDGDTLYVDRNGNGDLTEPGEQITADKGDGVDEGLYTFRIGDVHASRGKQLGAR